LCIAYSTHFYRSEVTAKGVSLSATRAAPS
jgi:hypothetical protein